MARRGHEVHVISRRVDFSPTELHGVKFHPISINFPDQVLSVLSFSRKARKLIAALEPDVVSANERFSAYFPSHLDFPFAFTIHSRDAFRNYWSFAVHDNPLNVVVHPWKCYLEEAVMKRSSLVFALTPSIRTYLETIGVKNVLVVPNAVDSSAYRCLGDRGYILYAGRLGAPKTVETLIEAFAQLTKVKKDISLKIVGSGPQLENLKILSSRLGITQSVEFTGWVSRRELASLMGYCTIFVLPSLSEALPVTLLEAMACSKPVVASAIPGPLDVVTDGLNGLLVQSANPEKLSTILLHLLDNKSERAALGRNARREIETFYDFERVTSEILQGYERIASAE
jgi:glycosyltransferase involved in cell wall biosynthesis